jgi:hypothetical protein
LNGQDDGDERLGLEIKVYCVYVRERGRKGALKYRFRVWLGTDLDHCYGQLSSFFITLSNPDSNPNPNSNSNPNPNTVEKMMEKEKQNREMTFLICKCEH